MAAIGSITVDCGDAASLAAFWAGVLGSEVGEGASEHFATVVNPDPGPGMMFIQVPERKTTKNRMHLDLAATDRTAEVERLVALGAEHVHDKDEWGHQWTTLRDPEGNEFCVSHPHL